MNIVVTGGAGFIGSHMARRHLADGHRVVVVDNLSTGLQEKIPQGTRFVQADIADVDLEPLLREEKIDFVSHHAAQIDVRHSVSDPLFDARSNILGSLKLFEACRRAGTKHVLFSSTGGALYGEPEGGVPAPESHPTDPISPYGCAKLSIEKYLHYYRVIHGFQTQIFRYANVYGPGQNGMGEAGVVAIFCEAILHGKTPKIRGDGGQTRDYIYVGDLVRAAAAAVSTDRSGTWNLGTGKETSVNDLFREVARALDYDGKPEYTPLPPGEQRRSVLDSSKVRADLGLPDWTPLSQGLKETSAYFREKVKSEKQLETAPKG
ncbi:MAG: NAD-dependent epimerase/dehydratase family protein [Acidobacteria bacterium]|nr:NAD-dependent epimerase/dehydratase family protein [Acidobacteriota bacterium]MCA1609748.1 NAD-dependent epimerase/dehydratase family protein [Acidobacteriota bacterium]